MEQTATSLGLELLGVIGALGIIQVIFSRDAEATTRCRQLCFELRELFEEFLDELFISTRDSNKDLPRLKAIKKITEDLYIAKGGMFVSCHLLNQLLDESMLILERIRPRPGNAADKPHFLASELAVVWGMEISPKPIRLLKIVQVQKFLHRSFFSRCFFWAISVAWRWLLRPLSWPIRWPVGLVVNWCRKKKDKKEFQEG
jgi:hypothetical protein